MTGWRKRQVINMAREAGWMHEHDSETGFVAEAAFKFAELVRAEEREKFLGALRQVHDSYSLASDSNGLKERGQE
jgi:hypothetical protein